MEKSVILHWLSMNRCPGNFHHGTIGVDPKTDIELRFGVRSTLNEREVVSRDLGLIRIKFVGLVTDESDPQK